MASVFIDSGKKIAISRDDNNQMSTSINISGRKHLPLGLIIKKKKAKYIKNFFTFRV